jgi:hypothetical protein
MDDPVDPEELDDVTQPARAMMTASRVIEKRRVVFLIMGLFLLNL